MSLCTRNRWGQGSGSSCSYTPKTTEAKEMEDKFKKMMEERNKLDTIWIKTTSNNNTKMDK